MKDGLLIEGNPNVEVDGFGDVVIVEEDDEDGDDVDDDVDIETIENVEDDTDIDETEDGRGGLNPHADAVEETDPSVPGASELDIDDEGTVCALF